VRAGSIFLLIQSNKRSIICFMSLRTLTWVTALVALLLLNTPAQAGPVLIEDFEAGFPAWESGWLGTNSNLTNYYGVGTGRGNNPDGLWIGVQDIIFQPSFAATLTSLSVDVAGHATASIEIYDQSGAILLGVPVDLTYGALMDPGVYAHYSVTSSNGIGGFRLLGSSVLGNTSIDNVVVNGEAVPEPGTVGLLAAGLFGLVLLRRRR
jgi:hypothetical protein